MNLYEGVNKNLNEEGRKRYLSEMEEEAKALFAKVDFETLFNKVREIVGDSSIQFKTPEFKGFHYDRFLVDIESENIADKCGVMSCVYSEVVIDNFGGGISKIKDTEEDLFLWLPMHFSYKHKSGGSNGTEIISATWTETEGWRYR